MDQLTANGQRMKEYVKYEELPSSPQKNIDDNVPPIFMEVSSSADEEQDIVVHPVEEVSLRVRGTNNDNMESNDNDNSNSRQILQNFIIMSILLSANHGAMVSCLAFATLELGSIGAYQSAILHLVFAMSSLMGATYTVKHIGAKTSISIGMACYSLYVASFWIALQYPSVLEPFAILGAIVGGLGGGLIWTAQGTYFGCASCEYATSLHSSEVAIRSNVEDEGDGHGGEKKTSEVSEEIDTFHNKNSDDERTRIASRSRQRRQHLRPYQRVQRQDNHNTNSTSLFGGIFAFVYLVLEVGTKVLSYVLLRNDNSSSSDATTTTKSSWNTVFAVYTIIALVSTLGMVVVKDYQSSLSYSPQPQQQQQLQQQDHEQASSSKFMYQFTSAWHLLVQDAKMKYMIGLSAAFGFASPFVNSYVNGEVLYKMLSNDESSTTSNTVLLDSTGEGSSSHLEYAGLFSAVTSIVAALCSLLFGHMAQYIGKGPILHFGSLCFAMVALPFLFSGNNSDDATMSWTTIVVIYVFQGIGRSTFEGTLKATFADFFSSDKESAFGNLVLQSGIFTSFGYYLSYGLQCAATGNLAAAGSDHHRQSSLSSLSAPSISPSHPHQNYCIRSKEGLKCTSIIPSDEDSLLSSSHHHDNCVRFKDGSLHNIAPLEWLIIVSCVFAILGYWRASILFCREQENLHDEDNQNHQEEEEEEEEEEERDEVSILSSYNICVMDHKGK